MIQVKSERARLWITRYLFCCPYLFCVVHGTDRPGIIYMPLTTIQRFVFHRDTSSKGVSVYVYNLFSSYILFFFSFFVLFPHLQTTSIIHDASHCFSCLLQEDHFLTIHAFKISLHAFSPFFLHLVPLTRERMQRSGANSFP